MWLTASTDPYLLHACTCQSDCYMYILYSYCDDFKVIQWFTKYFNRRNVTTSVVYYFEPRLSDFSIMILCI